MRRVLRLSTALSFASLLMSTFATLGTGTPVGAEGNFDGLTDCLEDQGALAALFLVDTSRSLKENDPGAARVPALQSAVRALSTLRSSSTAEAEPIEVYVEFLEFGTRTRRSFPETPEWAPLPQDVEGVVAVLDYFRDKIRSDDTDYVGALEPWFDRSERPPDEIGAIEMLELAPDGSCQLLIWFTDGQLDIDYQNARKEFHWAPEPLILRSKSGEFAIESRAAEVLCEPGGVVDRLRDNNGRLYAPFVAAVALEAGGAGSIDFSLMQRMALGEANGERCGAREASGIFLRATELPQLVSALRRPVLGNPDSERKQISTCLAAEVEAGNAVECEFPFFVSESLGSFNLLTTASGRGVDVSLVDPTGAVLALRAEGIVQNSVGASLDVSRPLEEVLLIDAELPAASTAWAGEWKVRYTTEDPRVAERIRNSAEIYVLGSLKARLRNGPDLIRGRVGRFRVELVSSDNSPRGPLAFGPGSQIVVTVDGNELSQPGINEDGSFEYEYSVPNDPSLEQLEVAVELRPQFVINDETPPIPLDRFSGPLGFIRVKDAPRYPVVEFLGLGDLTPLNVDNPVATGQIRVDASLTPESGGCITLRDITTTLPESMVGLQPAPEFEVLLRGESIAESAECAIELESGEIEILDVRIAFAPDQLRVPAGQVRARLLFQSTSGLDPTQSGSFEGEIVAAIKPKTVTGTDTGTAFWLMALAVGLPVAVMYAVSILYSSRFQMPEGAMRVSIPVIYQAGHIYRNEHGRPVRLALRDEDMAIAAIEGRWARRPEFGSFRFSIRPSVSPVGQPVASVREASSVFVTSRHGSRGQAGDPGSNLTNVWALAVGYHDLVGAGLGPDGTPNERGNLDPLHGKFMALVPSGADAARVFSEIVSEVERNAPDSLEPAVLTAAEEAKKREVRSPESDAPPRGDETQGVPSPRQANNQQSGATGPTPLPGDDDVVDQRLQSEGPLEEPQRRRWIQRRSKRNLPDRVSLPFEVEDLP